jgi:hypothetical protein
MAQQILSDYLAEIARIRATRAGTGEISYHGAESGWMRRTGVEPMHFDIKSVWHRFAIIPARR